MISPALPIDDGARLAALRRLGLLDTAADERFDRVTRLAQKLFDVPIALVTLVDAERQWFKSRLGLEVRETPRHVSFCAHAILEPDPMVVPDAHADVRFVDNPLVLGDPNIRFYAGVPLRVEEGHRVGTLCLIDRAPRALAPRDLSILCDLAAMVEGELATVMLANEDHLTAIANRRGFGLLAQQAMEIAQRAGCAYFLMMFDLNDFKAINDNFGHAEGDAALQCFAKVLVDTFRHADVVGRLGGDEFAVLATNAASADVARMLERLQTNVTAANAKAGKPYRVEFSVGCVQGNPVAHKTIEALLADADKLMYAQKRRRKAARATNGHGR